MKQQKNVSAHLKVALLQGHKLSSNDGLRMFCTSRLAVFINRLRKEGMKIKTEMVTEDGDTFVRYSLE